MHTQTHTHTHIHIYTHITHTLACFHDLNYASFCLKGCKFGLWVEPEMVSEDSLLNGMHPDWYLTVPGRPRQVKKDEGKD